MFIDVFNVGGVGADSHYGVLGGEQQVGSCREVCKTTTRHPLWEGKTDQGSQIL